MKRTKLLQWRESDRFASLAELQKPRNVPRWSVYDWAYLGIGSVLVIFATVGLCWMIGEWLRDFTIR